MMKELSLFTFGSFSEGMVHFNKISPYVVEQETAFVNGVVFRLPSGYPVYLHSKTENLGPLDRIMGTRVTLQAPDLVYHILDEVHGVSQLAPDKSLFFKENVTVETVLGEQKNCTIYAMNASKLPKLAKRVEAGDWANDMMEQPVLPKVLSEKQSTYIKKLSQSSGRDIVPIEIDLYRELMKLELIVDKGRRLALSKLGIEVARYLPE